MEKNYKIIFAAQDKGGFDAVLPVIKEFKKDRRNKIYLILDGPAYVHAKKLKIKSFLGNKKSQKQIENYIKKINPDVVFTATSRGFSIEKKVIKICKKLEKLSIAIVDYWGNYLERFGKKLEFLPDYVLALDEKMEKELIAQGIHKKRIIVTGNPRFDKFLSYKKQKEKKNLVVFYSQPFIETKNKEFDEVKIFQNIVRNFEKKQLNKKIIIKFHPAEKKYNKFDKIIKNTKLSVRKEKSLSSDVLSQKAELVIGINSIVLLDAILMGKKVLGYQPKFSRKYLDGKSTARVIKFIESVLKPKKIICVIQARMGSSRLPGKVMYDLLGKPVLLRAVDRVLDSKKIDHIIVATTTKKRDDIIAKTIKGYHPKVSFFRGSEMDLLDRFYKAVKEYKPRLVLRITADCPLIDPEIIDKVTMTALNSDADYVSNTLIDRTYPRGLDVDAFSFGLLKELWHNITWPLDREHVILFTRRNPSLFKCETVKNNKDYSYYRITLDEKDDYKLISKIYKKIYPKNPDFRLKHVIELFKKEPKLAKINRHVEQKNPHF